MEPQRCDACGLVLISTDSCDDNGNTIYRCPEKCCGGYCESHETEKIPNRLPLHIDFVKTFDSKNRIVGYWFLTWIRGPRDIDIWRKCSTGRWIYDAGGARHLPYPYNPPFKGGHFEVTGKGSVQATPNFAKKLDKILFQFIRDYEIPYEYPHKYWADPGDPPDPRDTEGLEDYYRRNSSQ